MAGRPKAEIDYDKLERMMALQMTQEHIAYVLGISIDTLHLRIKEHYKSNFTELFNKKREHGKMALREKMFEVAMKGNVPMLIWLSKQWLDMREPKQEIEVDTNKDVVDQISELASKL
jgi:ribosomal protein S17E